MFTTIEETYTLTGYAVDNLLLRKAQAIIESYVGRDEVEITVANDQSMLGKAVAYQAAYMKDNTDLVFEQFNASQIMQFGQMVTFAPGTASPWVAPLAVMACQRLSWRRMRSVKTGSIYQVSPVADWRAR
jgi:hypothetical protein